eukprot:c20568_g1_i4.p1 GENE.c20568_g1_i4~~c20568_g1_i4.p1  ORF type:complete len:100 (+),score=11.52 c20568_g1_i4:523-822(+)
MGLRVAGVRKEQAFGVFDQQQCVSVLRGCLQHMRRAAEDAVSAVRMASCSSESTAASSSSVVCMMGSGDAVAVVAAVQAVWCGASLLSVRQRRWDWYRR